MSNPLATQFPERYKKRSAAITFVVFIVMVLLLILPLLTYPTPPLGQEGVTVNLGIPDVGEGELNGASAPTPTQDQPETPPSEENPTPDPTPEPVESTPPPVEEVVEEVKDDQPTGPTQEELIAQQEAAALALQKQKAAAQKRQQELEAQRQKQIQEQQRIAEAKRQKAAEEAERKERARLAALTASTANLFNGNTGSGGGRGKTGKPGNQGDPNGVPNADRLTGIHSGGSGTIGGGLSNRGVLASPKISDSSQRTGKVVVKVCVNADGTVKSANYTQRGSTSSDEVLKKLAIRNAKRYKFSKSSASTQCGTITYDFVVQ